MTQRELTLAGLRIGIVGGSIGGLAAAGFLLDRGADVTIFERSSATLAERGAGIALDPDILPVLGPIAGRQATGRIVFGTNGQVLWHRSVRKFLTAWSEIYRALRIRVPAERVRPGQSVVRVSALGETVRLHFADGSSSDFDLVVGADGVGSVIREWIDPAFQPVYAGYVAVRGKIPMRDIPVSARPLTKWADAVGLVNCYGRRTHFVAYWIPGGDEEWVLNWMWYRNVLESELAAEFPSDDRGRTRKWSLPPGCMPDGHWSRILEEARQQLPHIAFSTVAATRVPSQQAIYHGVPDSGYRGRIALIGDAAHIAVPHIGAGCSTAIRDALTIATGLERDDLEGSVSRTAKSHYESVRRDCEVATRLGRSLQREETDWSSWSSRDFERWWNEIVGAHQLYFERGA